MIVNYHHVSERRGQMRVPRRAFLAAYSHPDKLPKPSPRVSEDDTSKMFCLPAVLQQQQQQQCI